jgi:hypothetical protein
MFGEMDVNALQGLLVFFIAAFILLAIIAFLNKWNARKYVEYISKKKYEEGLTVAKIGFYGVPCHLLIDIIENIAHGVVYKKLSETETGDGFIVCLTKDLEGALRSFRAPTEGKFKFPDVFRLSIGVDEVFIEEVAL